MDCRPLAYRQLPHQPKLFLEYLDHFQKVKSYYFHPPTMHAVTRAALTLEYPVERRAEVSCILTQEKKLLGTRKPTLSKSLRRDMAAGAIITAEQVWLLSRTAYCIY